jgi:hypothetical protein
MERGWTVTKATRSLACSRKRVLFKSLPTLLASRVALRRDVMMESFRLSTTSQELAQAATCSIALLEVLLAKVSQRYVWT